MFIRLSKLLLLSRPFGSIIYDLAAKYNGRVNISDLRKFEKLSIKTRKSELDLAFSRNFKSLNVFPKFLCFPLPANMDRQDAPGIRRKLLKSDINRRTMEHHRLVLERDRLKNRISKTLSSIDRYILYKSVGHKVTKGVKEFIKTHEKKLKNLTKNSVLLSRQMRLSPIFHLLLSTLISRMFSNMGLRTRFAHPRSTKRTSSHALN